MDENETANGRKKVNLKTALGVLRDGLRIAPVVETGFNSAESGIKLGFGIGRKLMNHIVPTDHTDNFMLRLEAVTVTGVKIGGDITKTSLNITDEALEKANVKKGETIRLLISFVEEQNDIDNDSKTSLLTIASLIGELSELLHVRDPLKLMKGAKLLLRFEQRRRALMEATQDPLPVDYLSNEDRSDFNLYLRYAASAYGPKGLIAFGYLSPPDAVRVQTMKAAVEHLTGITQRDVFRAVETGKLYRPGHFLAFDHRNKVVVVAIRGTMRIQDVLVDLVCERSAFSVGEMEGYAHKGMLICAERLAVSLQSEVSQALEKFPEYKLRITGHSLGAGVATLLALIWSRNQIFQSRDIHAFAFAPPCVLSSQLSQAAFTKDLITSIVCGDDIVSRLCFSTFKDLQYTLGEMSKLSKSSSFEDQLAVWDGIGSHRESTDEKLFPAGRVWLLDYYKFKSVPVEINPVEHLDIIYLTPSMLRAHMPGHQMRIIHKLT